MSPLDLIAPGSVSAPPRARLVICPERRLPSGEPLAIEVRSVPIADLLRYTGELAVAQAKDDGEVALDRLYVMLIIPACWSPVYDAAGVWQPGESTARVFRWSDAALVQRLPSPMTDRLFHAAADMAGLSEAEYNAAVERAVVDGRWGFAFELCEMLGCTLEELSARMPAYEMTWVSAYWQVRHTKQELAMEKAKHSSGSGEATSFG